MSKNNVPIPEIPEVVEESVPTGPAAATTLMRRR